MAPSRFRAAARNSAASASSSHSDRHTSRVRPLTSKQAKASPPQPAAAASLPSPNHVRTRASPSTPSRSRRAPGGPDGVATRRGASPDRYFSGWRTCSVDGGRLLQAALTASQPPFSCNARGEVAADQVGQHELVAHHRGHPRHRPRAEIAPMSLSPRRRARWPREALHEEALHHQGCVSFEQAHEGEAPVVEVPDRVRKDAVHVRVLVLQGVAQLVGEDELVGGGEGAVLADRVEALLARPLVVEAGDVLFQDARAPRAGPSPRAGGRGR